MLVLLLIFLLYSELYPLFVYTVNTFYVDLLELVHLNDLTMSFSYFVQHCATSHDVRDITLNFFEDI